MSLAAPEPVRSLRPRSTIQRLEAAVRPEFSVPVIYPSAGDPVLWGPACRVSGCPGGRVSSTTPHLCQVHYLRWRDLGQPDVAEFVTTAVLDEQRGVRRAVDAAEQQRRHAFRLEGLPRQLTLELQYGVQCRHDHRASRLFATDFTQAVKGLRSVGVTTLVGTEHRWNDVGNRGARAFLRFAAKQVARLLDADHLLDRDVWHPADFPQATTGLRASLQFEHLVQPWLRAPAKRWIKLRLDTGSKWSTVHANFEGLRRFSEYLSQSALDVGSMAEIERRHLVDYLGWLAARPMAPETRSKAISGVRLFLDDYRLHHWTPALLPTAVFRRGDAPPIPDALPRPIDEFVMRQIEAEDNLVTLPLDPADDPHDRNSLWTSER